MDYEHENPVTKAVELKTTYVERADDLIVCAGAYKGTGAILAVLGMDSDARAWKWMLVRAALPSALLTLALVALLVAGSVLLARRSRFATAPPRWMQHLEPALAIATGLVLTLFAVWMAHTAEARHRSDAFAVLATSQIEGIVDMLRDLRDTELEGLARFYEDSQEVTPDEFQQYTHYLTKNAAVQVWEWISAVPVADKPRFEEEARAAGLQGFAIWEKDAQGRRAPATGQELYYPVFRVAPLAGNERTLGYNHGAEPLFRAAMEKAAHTGLPTGTEPVTLVQKSGSEIGMLMYRPVFASTDPTRLCGFAVAVLCMEALVKNVDADQLMLELSLLRPDAAPEPLIANWNADAPPTAGISTTRPILVFAKTLSVTVHAGPAFARLYPMQAGGLAGLAGLLLTAALAVVMRVTIHRRESLELLVAERTNALRKSTAILSATLDATADGILAVGTQRQILFSSRKFAELWNVPQTILDGGDDDALLSHAVRQLVDPDAFAKDVQRIYASNDISFNTLYLKDGRVFERLSLPLQQQEAALPAGRVWSFRDITERKRAEEARRESEEKYRGIFDESITTVYLFDNQKNFINTNQAGVELLGYAREELLHLRIADVDADPVVVLPAHQTLRAGGRLINYEHKLRRKDGTIITVLNNSRPLTDRQGNTVGMLSTLIDITARKRAEAELLKMQKLQSVGTLAGGIAHDFNNILMGLFGNIALAKDALATEHPSHTSLAEAEQSMSRAGRLTTQLLTFAKGGTPVKEDVGLGALVDEIVRFDLSGSNVQLVYQPAEQVWLAEVDKGQIQQVISNLTINARQAMPAGGHLYITLANAAIPDAAMAGLPPGNYVKVTVRDEGSGIEAKHLARFSIPISPPSRPAVAWAWPRPIPSFTSTAATSALLQKWVMAQPLRSTCRRLRQRNRQQQNNRLHRPRPWIAPPEFW